MKKVFQPSSNLISEYSIYHYLSNSYIHTLQQKKQETYEPISGTLVVSFFQQEKVWHVHLHFSS